MEVLAQLAHGEPWLTAALSAASPDSSGNMVLPREKLIQLLAAPAAGSIVQPREQMRRAYHSLKSSHSEGTALSAAQRQELARQHCTRLPCVAVCKLWDSALAQQLDTFMALFEPLAAGLDEAALEETVEALMVCASEAQQHDTG